MRRYDMSIHNAAFEGDLRAVRRFVERDGEDVNGRDSIGLTPLHYACSGRHWGILRYLVERKADVDACVFQEKQTPLMGACQKGDWALASALLKSGANVNRVNARGQTPLLIATTNDVDGARLVPLLLCYGANTNYNRDQVMWQETPLMVASRNGNCATARLLLKSGAYVNDRDKNGRTAIHHAVGSDMVLLLVKHGADVNCVEESEGKTPLHLATNTIATDTLHALLASGASAWIQESSLGETVVHSTAKYQRALALRMILDQSFSTETDKFTFGSLLLSRNAGGKTAFHFARSVEIARMLLEQPRCGEELMPVCYEQFVAKDDNNETRLGTAKREYDVARLKCPEHEEYIVRTRDLVAYLESFAVSPLATPEAKKNESRLNNEHQIRYGRLGVQVNPRLNQFQRGLAAETLKLILETTKVYDNIAYGILGYLSPLDVMKRRRYEWVVCGGTKL